MGLRIYDTKTDPTSPPIVYGKLERFEFVRDTSAPEFVRIQVRFQLFVSLGEAQLVENGTIPKVFSIFAPTNALYSIPLVSYIYYYYRAQLLHMGFLVDNILEENQEEYTPPTELQYPTQYQPDTNPYEYRLSSICYFISINEPWLM
jgi:hypothetical protein